MITNLGKKIVVVGISASGKSTFSRKLAAKINLPLTMVDSIMWKPGWQYIGDEEIAKKLQEVSSGTEWIVEGYITKEARPFVFDRADSIIYLNYSSAVSSIRYIQRWWKHRTNPRPELPGSPEKFSFKFLRLVWTKGEALSLNKFLKDSKYQNKILYLKSHKQAQNFLKNYS
ncbi:MAG: hypothetical protein V4481_00715 [Patescibacteria group bacterium]